MKQEHKDLLLKDLCGRIMHGVKCATYEDTHVHTLSGIIPDRVYNELYFEELDWKECNGFADIQYCKPYLFLLSNMTEEQKQYISDRWGINEDFDFEIDPDWANQESPKYCIASCEGRVKTAERYIVNTILAFPTAEMRDAFYEVFREEIEICKEFL